MILLPTVRLKKKASCYFNNFAKYKPMEGCDVDAYPPTTRGLSLR